METRLEAIGQDVGDVAEGREQLTAQHLDADLIKQLGDFRVLGLEVQILQVAFVGVLDELVQLDGAFDNLSALFQDRVNVLNRGHLVALSDGRDGGNGQLVTVGLDNHPVTFRIIAVAVMRLTAQGLSDLVRVYAGGKDGAQLDQGDIGTGGATLGNFTNLGQIFLIHVLFLHLEMYIQPQVGRDGNYTIRFW